MSVSDIKRRADELATVSAKIKYLSKESKLDEIAHTIAESQKHLPVLLAQQPNIIAITSIQVTSPTAQLYKASSLRTTKSRYNAPASDDSTLK
jgi:hypothetical protein